MIIVKTDTSKLKAKVKSWTRQVQRSATETLEQEGRICAISLAKSTQPFGTGAQAKEMGERAVVRDIAKVYTTVGVVFSKLPDTGQGDAKQFWALTSQGKFDAARAILNRTGSNFAAIPIDKFDGGDLHRQARSSTTGRVGAHSRPDLIVSNNKALDHYVEEKKKMVGFAKSAWAGIARRLGGTRGLRSPKLPGGERDITANWITRKGAPGTVLRNYGNPSRPVLTLRSDVRYADKVLSPSAMRNAVRIAQERIVKQIEMAARYEMRHPTA